MSANIEKLRKFIANRARNAKDRDAAFVALFALAQSNDDLAKQCAGLRAAPPINNHDVEALKYGAYRIEDWAGKSTDESRRLLVLAFRLAEEPTR